MDSMSSRTTDRGSTPFRNLLPFRDRLRYVAWTLRGRRHKFQCRLHNGPRLWIRPFSSDWETAYEVFRLRTYETGIGADAVRRVVDLGGNVGYSCLFWCAMYPNAQVLTYEPHPVHSELLQRHMEANGYSRRVRLIPAGAAATASTAALSDNGNRSALVAQDLTNAGPVIEIAMVDFFETVGSEAIDILKIDIEGGEYDLLQDSRFDNVAERCGCIVMEWHKRAPNHLGGRWSQERLRALGFAVRDMPDPSPMQDIGTILAFRNP